MREADRTMGTGGGEDTYPHHVTTTPNAGHRAASLPAARTPPWRYAIGMLGTSIPINLIKASMLYFYVDLLGMNAKVYAAVYTVYAIIDAIDNPIFGYISDRTRTRWGRRRPYLVVGAILLGLTMIALFAVPETVAQDATTLVIWFAVFAILSEMADSVINANYGALLPELYPKEKARAKANSIRQAFQMMAMVIALGLTPILAERVFGADDSPEGYAPVAALYAVLAVAVIVYMAVGVHEDPAVAREERPKLLASVRDIVTSKYFWTIGVVSACYGGAMALVLNGVRLYVRYTLGGGAWTATLLQVTVIVGAIGFITVWTVIVRHKGAAWTWRLALPTAAFCFVPLYYANSTSTAIVAGAFVAFGYSGMLATNDLVLARVLDADAAAHGVHREGVFLSAFGVLGRISGILMAVSLASLSIFFGYESGNNPGPQPDQAFRYYMSVYPFILLAIGATISRFITVPGSDENPESVKEVVASGGRAD